MAPVKSKIASRFELAQDDVKQGVLFGALNNLKKRSGFVRSNIDRLVTDTD